LKIKVLYEDSNILAIDKPSGISVHADGRTKEKTITDWVLKNYPKMKNVGEPLGDIARPGVVHRLDRDTSGVLILAKNQKAHEFLKKQFQNREVKKVYNTIVSGWVKNDHGILNNPIGRSPSDFRRYLAGRGARGTLRDAVTEYKVLKRFEAKNSKFSSRSSRGGSHADKKIQHSLLSKFTYLEIKPKTGRTHQIRVHMKYLNHPVVCDSLYNPESPCPKDIKRMALHAVSIEFTDPKGKLIKVESKLPPEFQKVLKSK
jgi:23S rRNA pseudouridine1911/1915/1917 synthase